MQNPNSFLFCLFLINFDNLILPWRDQSNSREGEKPFVTSRMKATPFTIFSVARCATIHEIKRKNYWPNQIKSKSLPHIQLTHRRPLLRIEILAFKSDLFNVCCMSLPLKIGYLLVALSKFLRKFEFSITIKPCECIRNFNQKYFITPNRKWRDLKNMKSVL